MSVLKSRPLPGDFKFFESLELGNSITFAEESFRKVLAYHFGADMTIVHREIIVPNRKNRPEALPHDPDGHMLQGDLAERIARSRWDNLSERQKNEIYNTTGRSYRTEHNDDFDSRIVFFRAMVRFPGDELPKLVLAKVTAFALSQWWNMAGIQIWHRQYHYIGEYGEPKYKGVEFQIDSRIHCTVEEKDWQPPEFLKLKQN